MFLPMKTNEKLFDFKNKPKYTPGMIWLLRVSVQNPDTSTIWDRSFGISINRWKITNRNVFKGQIFPAGVVRASGF